MGDSDDNSMRLRRDSNLSLREMDFELLRRYREHTVIEIRLQEVAESRAHRYAILINIGIITYIALFAVMMFLTEAYWDSHDHEILHILGLVILCAVEALNMIMSFGTKKVLHQIALYNLRQIISKIDETVDLERTIGSHSSIDPSHILHEIEYMKNITIKFTPTPPVFVDTIIKHL